ncbi:hypothetical protein Athai_39480 [Actinocatenispora thailandica]|uniref:Uncharacterized protein n=1 Tax=Actinocatenispora thailandica TaxID=227318 RepID=A0A7R7DRB4_9ACTN|nr:hypothetical protein [Actinocatenispora thailandica]BCJ36445.1 hypothetical protein Athai_39480 [Actinocatenispora thailandica]
MTRPELAARPGWRRTGDGRFPAAARVDGRWWVLRLNGFPDHPLWTLFVAGAVRYDLDTTPVGWDHPLDRSAPALPDEVAATVLAPVRPFAAYGSEHGQPCDGPFCCDG